MKQIFLSIAMLFSALCAKAQADANNWESPLVFDYETYDYGTIKNGADGSCEFRFKNTGREPVVISNARGSCGCTVPEWPKEPIAPGKTGSIKVVYDTKRTGAINKNVTVTINNIGKDKTATKTLFIKGNVEPPPPDAGTPERSNTGAPMERN